MPVNFSRTTVRNMSNLVMAGALGMTMFASSSASAETLRYSDHDPLGGMRTQFVNDVWLAEIEQQSGVDLDVKPFFGGVLMGSKEILTGIGQGITDLGFVYPGHYPERLVAHTIFPLFPRGPSNFEDMAWFYHEVYNNVPAFAAEFEAAGVVPLMVTAGLPGAFSASYEMNSLQELDGKKWRAGGKWPLKYLGNAGATPVSVPWGDIYVALQTGTIDGVFTNYDGLHLMKFDEVAPNLLVSKELWFAVPFIHMMNKAKFDALSSEAQQALRDASAAAEQQFGATYDATFDEIRKTQEAAGAEVTDLSPEDVMAWENKDALATLRAEWVEAATAAGLTNAAEVMEQVSAIHAEAMSR
jgi:TRAP-type C4-dicarboxylate transport system substrate-binding protein